MVSNGNNLTTSSVVSALTEGYYCCGSFSLFRQRSSCIIHGHDAPRRCRPPLSGPPLSGPLLQSLHISMQPAAHCCSLHFRYGISRAAARVSGNQRIGIARPANVYGFVSMFQYSSTNRLPKVLRALSLVYVLFVLLLS